MLAAHEKPLKCVGEIWNIYFPMFNGLHEDSLCLAYSLLDENIIP